MVSLRRSAIGLLLVAGCSGGGGGGGNDRPDALIIEPHDGSSHLPGEVDFEGRATDAEDGVLGASALSWQVLDVDGDVVGAFQGAEGAISLLVAGEYTAVLFAEDSKGKTAREEHPFRIASTVARLSDPDNESFIPIAQPFDLDGFAETVAPGTDLATMVFVGIDLDDDSEVFRLPVAVPPGNDSYSTTVTPSVSSGRYRLRLEVTTTNAAEAAEDNIRVVADAAPIVAITSPANGTTVSPGTSIQFTATVSDVGGGTPAIAWTSSVSGALSDELSFTRSNLGRAKHRITVTATDENGLRDTASVDVYIEDAGSPLFVTVTGLPDSDVRAVSVEPGSPDLVWAGTAAGLANYAADTAVLGASHTTGYNSNGTGPTTAAFCMSTGECLFGIGGQGVSIRDSANTTWSTFDPVTGSVVNGFDETSVGPYLYFATEQGLTRTDLARANSASFNTGLLDELVYAVAVDADGVVWAGTDGNGLVRLALPSTVTNVDSGDGLAENVVRAVAIAVDGAIWAGTDSGLSRYDPVTSVITTWDDELPSGSVRALAFAGDVLWIGTENGGARFDTGDELWTIFDESDLPGSRVNAIAVDGDGAVWFGCGANDGPGGLVRYDGP